MEGAGPHEGTNAGPPGRGRILLAFGALAGFGAIVAVVAVTSGSSDESKASAAAPIECLRAWNGDRDAVAFARHNSIFHNYNSAQVGYLAPAPDASVSASAEDGSCTVVFARNQLDPEPEAAGQVLQDGTWTPLIDVADVNTVARLQSEAFEGANAKPTIDGEVVASDMP